MAQTLIKLLILEALLINHGTGDGGQHTERGFAEVTSPDTARELVATGKAMYTNPRDDPRKDRGDTATPDDIKAVESQIAAAEKLARQKAHDSAEAAVRKT